MILKKIERIVPHRAIIPLIICLSLNNVVYFIPRLFLTRVHHYDFTCEVDRVLPFVPGWIYVYLICYVFWTVNYILVGRGTKEDFYRFLAAEITSKLICGLFFVLLPTTRIRPVVTGSDPASWLLQFIYHVDENSNLFPSIHCLVSWFCFLGIRARKDIPMWYKAFSLVFAVMVCISTQLTRQHYLVDLFGGVVLAEVMYEIYRHGSGYKWFERFFEWINRKVWRAYESKTEEDTDRGI